MERKKVLLVDDVRLFLHLEETFFKRTGCEILTASSGKEALEVAESRTPDLILLDYLMPDMSGDQVCREIRKRENLKAIPVMIVSTSANESDIQKCFAAGANDYVTKPINPQEVLAKAADLMKVPYRLHFRIPVHFKVQGEAQRLTFTAFSRNISRGGILIECEKKMALGSLVETQFRLQSEGSPLEVTGEVARVSFDDRKGVYLVGIKFRELDPVSQSVINDFVEIRRPQEQ
jgi:uncharacterized protein (TIGR02266 family)